MWLRRGTFPRMLDFWQTITFMVIQAHTPSTGFLLLKALQIEAHQAHQTTAFEASYHTWPPLALARQQNSIVQHTSWAATAPLLKKEKSNLEWHQVPLRRRTREWSWAHQPSYRTQNLVLTFSLLSLHRVIVMPLATRHPQLPEPLHACCVKVYPPDLLSSPAQSSSSNHHVKTWFAKKLLLAKVLNIVV